jgi:hypothetical protein
MSLLWVLVSHQKRQDMVEQRSCSKLSGIDCNLPQSRLSHVRVSIFDFQEQSKDSSLFLLFQSEVSLVDIFKKRSKEFVLFGLDWRKISLSGFERLTSKTFFGTRHRILLLLIVLHLGEISLVFITFILIRNLDNLIAILCPRK